MNKPVLTEEDLGYICDSVCRYPAMCTEEEMEKYCDECIITKKLSSAVTLQNYEERGIRITAENPPKKCIECPFCIHICKEDDTKMENGCFISGMKLGKAEEGIDESCQVESFRSGKKAKR